VRTSSSSAAPRPPLPRHHIQTGPARLRRSTEAIAPWFG
jgi:hypothetical protein